MKCTAKVGQGVPLCVCVCVPSCEQLIVAAMRCTTLLSHAGTYLADVQRVNMEHLVGWDKAEMT